MAEDQAQRLLYLPRTPLQVPGDVGTDLKPPVRVAVKKRKRYVQTVNRETGHRMLFHRAVAAEMLGRPLLPDEIVHHRDGDSLNNTRENLLVLPSQRYHAHVEYHLRCVKRGMPSLFPELLGQVEEDRRGTLFEGVLVVGK